MRPTRKARCSATSPARSARSRVSRDLYRLGGSHVLRYDGRDTEASMLYGTPDEIAKKLDALRRAGIHGSPVARPSRPNAEYPDEADNFPDGSI